jgi:hypothetical protein
MMVDEKKTQYTSEISGQKIYLWRQAVDVIRVYFYGLYKWRSMSEILPNFLSTLSVVLAFTLAAGL